MINVRHKPCNVRAREGVDMIFPSMRDFVGEVALDLNLGETLTVVP